MAIFLFGRSGFDRNRIAGDRISKSAISIAPSGNSRRGHPASYLGGCVWRDASMAANGARPDARTGAAAGPGPDSDRMAAAAAREKPVEALIPNMQAACIQLPAFQ